MKDWDTREAERWARNLLRRKNWCILDTEGTGLSEKRRACEIAIIDEHGIPLLNTRVNPEMEIELGAIAVHHLTLDILKDAPIFPDIYDQFCLAVTSRLVLIYNVPYDRQLIRNCCEAYGLPIPRCNGFHDVMTEYSRWHGTWSPRFRNYRYKKLPGAIHGALGDCLATLAVIRKVAGDENWDF